MTLESLRLHGLIFQLKINVTFENLRFSWVNGPVEDQYDLGKFVFFYGLVVELKITVTLESLYFSWVSVLVEDQGDFGKFVFFMG